MKYIKKFENYSINEEEGLRKFFTGHDSSDSLEKSKLKFKEALEKAELDVKENPDLYYFNKEALLKSASDNKFLGGLRTQIGGRDKSRYYIVYDPKSTGWENLASAAAKRDLK